MVDPRVITPRNTVARLESGEPSEPLVGRLIDTQGVSWEPPLGQEPIVATLVDSVADSVDHEENPQFDQQRPTTEIMVDDRPPANHSGVRVGIVRRFFGFAVWIIRGSFCIASLVVLLAVLTAIPILQLVAFGYLLNVAGRLTNGVKLRDALPNLREAGMIGMAATAIFLAALPTQMLVHWESVASLINPGSNQAIAMRVLAILSALLTTGYLLWAWIRGGSVASLFVAAAVTFSA